MKKRLSREIRELPLFPLFPFVPAVLMAGAFAFSALCFARLRKISQALAAQQPLPAGA